VGGEDKEDVVGELAGEGEIMVGVLLKLVSEE